MYSIGIERTTMSRVGRTIKKLSLLAAMGFAVVTAARMTDNFLRKYDRSIIESLDAQLASEERFRDVQIEVKEGTVLLTGSVKVLEDKREVFKKANETEHVRSVKDQVAVNTVWVPDRFLRKQLYQKLQSEKVDDVGLKVRKGVVTIRGEVRTKADRERILALISGTDGVKAVTDRTTQRRKQ
jgi:osmotically-inducible protein OsmY